MKRSIIVVSLLMCVLFCFAGCGNAGNLSTRKAYTFKVDTGDQIKIEIDTTDGYDLTSEVPFEILYEGEELSQGTFIEAADYEQYVEVVNSDPDAELIESGVKGLNQYIFWSYNNNEFDIAILIGDSNTGILLGNVVSEESAKECFEKLTITVE